MKLPWDKDKPTLADVIEIGEQILVELERLGDKIDKEQESDDDRTD